MQVLNGAPFLNITFILVLFTAELAASVFETVIVALKCMFVSL